MIDYMYATIKELEESIEIVKRYIELCDYDKTAILELRFMEDMLSIRQKKDQKAKELIKDLVNAVEEMDKPEVDRILKRLDEIGIDKEKAFVLLKIERRKEREILKKYERERKFKSC